MKKEDILPNAVYSTEEVAEILGLSTQTVQRYIRERLIEATVFGGKWYRVTGKDLLKYLDRSKQVQIIPCSWRLEDGWVPRVDIVEFDKNKVNVTNWTWENKRLDSKEAADYIAHFFAKRKLLGEGVENSQIDIVKKNIGG